MVASTTPRPLKRVWILLCDGSIAGIYRTGREAESAAAMRRHLAGRHLADRAASFTVDGPYLRRNTKGRAR
jgi:hypothetical protein